MKADIKKMMNEAIEDGQEQAIVAYEKAVKEFDRPDDKESFNDFWSSYQYEKNLGHVSTPEYFSKKNAAAVSLGRLGGSVSSKTKSLASRENGKLGGRPKKME